MGRVGSKKSDRRWKAPDGSLWDSKVEWNVYDTLRKQEDLEVRRCDERDTLSYTTPVRSGRCVVCGADGVVQERTYTPDLCVRSRESGHTVLLEVKGFMHSSRRSQLRAAIRQNPDADVRFVLQSKYTKATKKLKLYQYIDKYMKVPWIIWEGEYPDAWK